MNVWEAVGGHPKASPLPLWEHNTVPLWYIAGGAVQTGEGLTLARDGDGARVSWIEPEELERLDE